VGKAQRAHHLSEFVGVNGGTLRFARPTDYREATTASTSGSQRVPNLPVVAVIGNA
jgi:hypothetical protein